MKKLQFILCLVVVSLMALPQTVNGQEEQQDKQKQQSSSESPENVEEISTKLAPSGKMIKPNWEKVALQQMIQDLARFANVNIGLGENVDPEQKISYSTTVPMFWRDVLESVLSQEKLTVRRVRSNQLVVERPKRLQDTSYRNAEFTSVVQSIAKLANASIIISPKVQEKQRLITLTFKDVPWQKALEQVVETAGFSLVREKYGILRVITAEEMKSQLETKTFKLKYLRPPANYEGKIDTSFLEKGKGEDPKEWQLLQVLRSVLTRSPGGEKVIGSMMYDSNRNVLIVRDTPEVIRRIGDMLELMDTEPPQVLIRVRFISTSNQFLRDFGMEFVPQGPGSIANFPNSTSGLFTSSTVSRSSGQTTAPNAPNNISKLTTLPFGLGGLWQNATNTAFLTQIGAQWVFRMFQRDRATRIVQSPRLTVVDGQKATVFVGDEIHFGKLEVEVSQSGGGQTTITQNVEEQESSPVQEGFQLFVVPHVVRGTDRIMLTVVPDNRIVDLTQNQITFTPTAAQNSTTVQFPIITSSTVVTRMILKSGNTAVLAGLKGRDDSSTQRKVPFLSDVPYLGNLFSAEGKSKQKTHDFFFITAHILPSVQKERDELQKELNARKASLENMHNKLQGKQQNSLGEWQKKRKKKMEQEFEQLKNNK